MVRLCAAHVRDIAEMPAELGSATARLTRHALGVTFAATGLVSPEHRVLLVSDLGLDQVEHGITTAGQATAWLDAERDWLRAMAEHWNAAGSPELAATLVDTMAKYIDRRSLWRDFFALAEQAVTTWRQAGRRVGLASALTDLTTAYWRLGDSERALAHGRAALDLWESLGDPAGQATALPHMGRVHYRHSSAVAAGYHQRCVDLRRVGNEPRLLGRALQHLGPAQFNAGEQLAGIAATQEALQNAREVQDEATERNCVNSLGIFWIELGEHARAEPWCRSALAIADRLGDRQVTAATALNLAICQVELGRPDAAIPLLDRSLELSGDLGDTIGQIEVLVTQARSRLALGRPADARVLLDTAAAALAEELSDPLELSTVHLGYGELND